MGFDRAKQPVRKSDTGKIHPLNTYRDLLGDGIMFADLINKTKIEESANRAGFVGEGK